MNKKETKFLLLSFFSWRILLFVFLFLAISIVPLQKDFLGGGLVNYLKTPHLWAWANFDGEHYLSIARRGYQPLTYFFFPVYPLIIGLASKLISDSFISPVFFGLLISHAALFVALIGIWRLIRLDYKRSIARFAILLFLVFPTSFYFGSLYTESLFLAATVWSFYFARKGNWLYAGLLGAVSTATRVVGLALVPAFLVEAWLQKKRGKGWAWPCPVIGILLVPLGLLVYMHYLKSVTGDPLEFFHSVSIFGQQRSTSLVLLPQVFYRYIFKILPSINYDYFPVVFSTFLEFSVALVFLAFSVLAFFRLRPSYALYLAVGYLIPTLSGSFSSLSRYVLVLFPAFLLAATWLSKKPRWIKIGLLFTLLLLLGVATALFVRGFWVA